MSVFILLHYAVTMHADRTGGLLVQHLPGVREVVGSISGRVIPKTLKMELDASLLSTRHLKERSRTYGRFPPLSTVKCDLLECYICSLVPRYGYSHSEIAHSY